MKWNPRFVIAFLVLGSTLLLSLGFQGLNKETGDALHHIIITAKDDKRAIDIRTVNGGIGTGVPAEILVSEGLVHLTNDNGDTYVPLRSIDTILVHRERQ